MALAECLDATTHPPPPPPPPPPPHLRNCPISVYPPSLESADRRTRVRQQHPSVERHSQNHLRRYSSAEGSPCLLRACRGCSFDEQVISCDTHSDEPFQHSEKRGGFEPPFTPQPDAIESGAQRCEPLRRARPLTYPAAASCSRLATINARPLSSAGWGTTAHTQ